MGFLDTILTPIMWLVAWILVIFHNFLTSLGLSAGSGMSWVLSIVGLVVFMRILLIPLFFKQIKASRGMQILQPDMQRLQKKYKGKNDPASRQAMQAEMMALYKEHGTNPFSSCLPILAQTPFFFALFRVLYSLRDLAAGTYKGGDIVAIGPITQQVAAQFESASIFGARLSSWFLMPDATANVRVITVILIILMSGTVFTTQRQLTMKNMPKTALDNPMAKQQRMLMYVMPLVFAFSGVNFPIGVLLYWLTTNLWTMAQQFYTIRRLPAPGSEAERNFQERERQKFERKAERKGIPVEELLPPEPEAEQPARGQRVQPKRKDRQKRPGGPLDADAQGSSTKAEPAAGPAKAEDVPSAPVARKPSTAKQPAKQAAGSSGTSGKTPEQRAAERHAQRVAQRRADLERKRRKNSGPGGRPPGK